MNNIRPGYIIQFVSIFITTLLVPVVLVGLSQIFYKTYFISADIYNNFPESSKAQVDDEFDNLIDYLSFLKGELTDFYSTEDKIHMKDVKSVFLTMYILIFLSVISLIFNKIVSKKVSLSASVSVVVTVFTFVFIVSILGFDKFFILFHKPFFRNDYWLLDPKTSNLIKFFPQELFMIQATLIGGLIIVLSSINIRRCLIDADRQNKK